MTAGLPASCEGRTGAACSGRLAGQWCQSPDWLGHAAGQTDRRGPIEYTTDYKGACQGGAEGSTANLVENGDADGMAAESRVVR
jgi:hypothetical protein